MYKTCQILTALFFAFIISGVLNPAYAKYPKKITTVYPVLNLPRPTDDPRWTKAFDYWDHREETENVSQAFQFVESIAKDTPQALEPHLWVERCAFLMGTRNLKQGEFYSKKGLAAADKP